jgi:hypothetical protein
VAYDPCGVRDAVVRQLARAPGQRKAVTASILGIDRHTLKRALSSAGTTYETLQDEARRTLLVKVRDSGRVLSAKETAVVLGFMTSRALRRWLESTCR